MSLNVAVLIFVGCTSPIQKPNSQVFAQMQVHIFVAFSVVGVVNFTIMRLELSTLRRGVVGRLHCGYTSLAVDVTVTETS